MKIELKKIFEHDMDLLIMEEFISDKGFAKLFLDKIGFAEPYCVLHAFHSKADTDGESDITFVLETKEEKIGLLIEDKIDAPTMKDQSQRYDLRGNSGISAKLYDRFEVMLACPEAYWQEHKNDPNANYRYHITYEELSAYFAQFSSPRAAFKKAVINFAIAEKKTGYIVQESEAVTLFWKQLRDYCGQEFPTLTMVGAESPKGNSARWPEFRTSLGKIKVIYKSQKGCVDLEFPQYGERTGDLISYIREKTDAPLIVEQTGKAASIRLKNDFWATDFSRPFDEQMPSVHGALAAVEQLCRLAQKLNSSDLY